jgi:hypothetical protein
LIEHGMVLSRPRPWTAKPAQLTPWVTEHRFEAPGPYLESDKLTREQEALVEHMADNLSAAVAAADFLSRGGTTMELPGPTWEPVGHPKGKVPPPEELREELGFDQGVFRQHVRKGRMTPAQKEAQREVRPWIALRIAVVQARYKGQGINEALADALGCSLTTIEDLAAEGQEQRELRG